MPGSLKQNDCEEAKQVENEDDGSVGCAILILYEGAEIAEYCCGDIGNKSQ